MIHRIVFVCTVMLVVLSMYVASQGGVAEALDCVDCYGTKHAPSQGSQGFSVWRDVTWNDRFVVVRHKHTSTGTVCERLYSDPNRSYVQRFKLVSLNGNNHDCVPDGRQG